MSKPRSDLQPNTFDFENLPLVTANGFREYDARWLLGPDINLLGVQALPIAHTSLTMSPHRPREEVKPRLGKRPEVGAYNQEI